MRKRAGREKRNLIIGYISIKDEDDPPNRYSRFFSSLTKAFFRCENFLDFDTVAFLFVYDKYYPIMD